MRRPKKSDFCNDDGYGVDYDEYAEKMSEYEDEKYEEMRDDCIRMEEKGNNLYIDKDTGMEIYAPNMETAIKRAGKRRENDRSN